MRRSRLILLALLGLTALPACGEEEPKKPSEDGGGEDTDAIDPVEDDIDTTDPGYIFGDAAVLSASPATLPEATGGTASFQLRVAAKTSEGEPAPLSEALAEAEIVVTLPDDTDVPAEVTVDAEDLLTLTIALPAGLSRAGGVIAGTVWVNDEFLADVPLRVHEAAEPALTDLLAGALPGIDTSDLREVCGATAVETDGDGVAEVLLTGIDGDGDLCARGCVGYFDEGSRGWECEDTCL